MKRIIVDTQSNRLFRGLEVEQDFDQRGGLCQIGKGHIVVTTNPIDPAYLEYWQTLGFTIPHLITAGPFDPQYTLSELILQKKGVQEEIKALAKGIAARLEFYCIEETETDLSRVLEIPAYSNFDVSIRLSRKIPFKKICTALSISSPFWIFAEDRKYLFEEGKKLMLSGIPIVIKANDGIGGISCGGIFKPETVEDLEAFFCSLRTTEETFFLEKQLYNNIKEVSIHWEICEDGKIILIGLFDQISRNFSYAGCSYPVSIPHSIRNLIEFQLREILGPHLIQQGAKGYFCCDIIIDNQGIPYWTDFHPRKGAIRYIWDMVLRLSEIHFKQAEFYFWHEHIRSSVDNGGNSFHEVAKAMSDLLTPGKNPFVVITNPGVIRFGYIDITGISINSKWEAKEIFEEAKRRLIAY